MAKKLVSVIITTKNEEDVIGDLIKSITGQTYPNIEIILVDNHSTDKTVEVAKRFNVKTYLFGPERSAQRNFGAKKSQGQYLIFLDADMELSSKVIKECVDLMIEDGKCGGIVIPEESVGKTFWGKVKAFERSFYNLEGDDTTDAARFFSREAYIKTGGFDETITGPEDWDFPENVRKTGFKIKRINSIIYHHERISSPLTLAKKKYYYALKSSKYLSKNGISAISPKTIYFLRPVFYKNWKRLISNPLMFLAMIYMLTLEQIGGGLGYIRGRING